MPAGHAHFVAAVDEMSEELPDAFAADYAPNLHNN